MRRRYLENGKPPYDGIFVVRNYGTGGDLYVNGNLAKSDLDSCEKYAGGMFVDGVVLRPGDVVEIRNAVVDDIVGTQGSVREYEMLDILYDLPDGEVVDGRYIPVNPRALSSSFVFGNFTPWSVVALSDVPEGSRFAFLSVSASYSVYPVGGYALEESIPVLGDVQYVSQYIYKGDEYSFSFSKKNYVSIPFRSTSDIDAYVGAVSLWGDAYFMGFQLTKLGAPASSFEYGIIKQAINSPGWISWVINKFPSSGDSRLLAV